MSFKYEPTMGLKVSNLPNTYMPELIMTLWMDPALPHLKQEEKLSYYQNFGKTFDHYEFYAKLENDLRINHPMLIEGLKKMDDNLDLENFLNLYLMIDKEESDLTSGYKAELAELRSDIKKPSKQRPNPKLQPQPGMESEEDPKKKRPKPPGMDSIYAPPKLRLS